MRFTIPGEPVGKARPKVVMGGMHTYTPEKTVNYETLVKMEYQHEAKGYFIAAGPVRVQIDAYFSIPKATSKKKRREMLADRVFPTKKPDWDNIGKIVCDALNGLAYKDDAQVVSASVFKHFSDQPHVDVIIEEVRNENLLDSLA